ncbi:hypothetical protein RJ639_024719 [Escallonia herrerae]|uniref:Retrotransposon gag domain-containing protein n=1 Tax=Escallonia herrerae TaxID=1293975 RepID=A0AA88UXE0_9ASTE|nr:hypothetical protein RJ639_024719 [Escallonia herrerae]
MWKKFNRELKRQFYPDSVKDMAIINLRRLRQKRSIREYVKEYSTLMLVIYEMFERQLLCFFVDGLQQWVATELWRREPHDLASAMAITERLEDFKQSEGPRSPWHEFAKDGGDGRSKSGSPKATDDEGSEDEGRRRHHKGEKKHEGSSKRGGSLDHKAHGGPKGGCFYCACLQYGRAEYMALTEATKETLWLNGLVEQLGFKQRGVLLQCDSQSAIDLAKNQGREQS